MQLSRTSQDLPISSKTIPVYGGSGKLTKHIITKITQAARKAITAHSCTGDVEALRSNFRNGPKH